jgi:metallo-beta-lactamase family protein
LIKIIHHGAHEGVTGSCHQLWLESSPSRSVLVDCGTFQGDDARRHPAPEIDFPLDDVAALLVTHVHIDHIGRIPYLLAAGFRQPILCSQPTARLLPLMLEDAMRVGFSRNRRLIKDVVKEIERLIVPLDYHQWHDTVENVRIRLRPAGHILGSTVFEVELADGQIVVFSGDLGASGAPLMVPPQSPPRADLLILESTYGDRLHPARADRRTELQGVLERTLGNAGTTIIPAFSLGRTQELLFEMNGIFEQVQQKQGNSLLKRVDVIVDSPLANRLTTIYNELSEFWGAEAKQTLAAGDQPLVFENLMQIDDHEEHQDTLAYLADRKLPAIVIAGSGMCTGGRVVNYLKRLLPEPSTDVVLVGYQSKGTPGRYLQEGVDWVGLDGQQVTVRAKVHSLSGYSGHADQADLLRFVDGFEVPPKHIRLVHGEDKAKAALAALLSQRGFEVT